MSSMFPTTWNNLTARGEPAVRPAPGNEAPASAPMSAGRNCTAGLQVPPLAVGDPRMWGPGWTLDTLRLAEWSLWEAEPSPYPWPKPTAFTFSGLHTLGAWTQASLGPIPSRSLTHDREPRAALALADQLGALHPAPGMGVGMGAGRIRAVPGVGTAGLL